MHLPTIIYQEQWMPVRLIGGQHVAVNHDDFDRILNAYRSFNKRFEAIPGDNHFTAYFYELRTDNSYKCYGLALGKYLMNQIETHIVPFRI